MQTATGLASTTNLDEYYDVDDITKIAQTIKPLKSKSKKGKKFADRSFMLSLVDMVNKVHEEKIQSSLEKEVRWLFSL